MKTFYYCIFYNLPFMPWLETVEIEWIEAKIPKAAETREGIEIEKVAKVMLEEIGGAKWISRRLRWC
jgi:hypothetical protein